MQGVKIKGFYRVHITDPDGAIVGDSGWVRNQVTNLGFNQFLVSALGSIAGSKYVSHLALGTGTVPGAAATALDGEVTSRQAVTAATSATSKTLRLTGTFSSADNFVGATVTLQNIGLFNSASGGTLFAGNTYATSTCATNQNVNCTYDIIFS
jgi:hypothetical protein